MGFAKKLADNSSVSGGAAYDLDEFKLFSDLDGTITLLEDNFEDYVEGDSFDDNTTSPYNSATAEAVVAKKNSALMALFFS